MTRDAREIAREIVRKWTGNAPDGARPPKVLPTFQETLAGAIAAAIEKDRAETIERCAKLIETTGCLVGCECGALNESSLETLADMVRALPSPPSEETSS